MIITNPAVRKWIYGIASAALAVLGVYGIVSGEQITAWSGLASAITGLAAVNTPAGGKQEG
ncbi:phage holin [Actinomyces naeslundii]